MNNPSPKLKLLFLDNSRTMRAAMSMFLTDQGYEVTTVSTGQEAIERIKTDELDVAIMDLYMPFMNGHETAKVVRGLPGVYKDIPIIALTASDDERDKEICKNAGMNNFILKSEKHEALLIALEEYYQKKRQSQNA